MKDEERQEYGTDGGNNYCRNPNGEGKTIWCYVGDPLNPTKELCDPIGWKDPNKCAKKDEVLSGTKDDLYRGC